MSAFVINEEFDQYLQAILFEIHNQLEHWPSNASNEPSEDQNSWIDPTVPEDENPVYSDAEQQVALRAALKNATLVNLQKKKKAPEKTKYAGVVALVEHYLSVLQLQSKIKSGGFSDSGDRTSALGDAFSQSSNLHKSLSMIKTAVEPLTDFTKIISSKKPEDVMLFLVHLRTNLSQCKVQECHWPLCLSSLTTDHNLNQLLVNLGTAVDMDTGVRTPRDWNDICAEITMIWARHWNPILYQYQVMLSMQGNTMFQFFQVVLQNELSLVDRNLLREPPEFLQVRLRPQILKVIYVNVNSRKFNDMRHLISEVQSAIANDPSIDGTAQSFAGKNLQNDTLFDNHNKQQTCSWCKKHKPELFTRHDYKECKARIKAVPSAPLALTGNGKASSVTGVPMCFHCGTSGHISPECPSKAQPQSAAGKTAQAASGKKPTKRQY